MCGTSRRGTLPRCYADAVTLRPGLCLAACLAACFVAGACTSDDLFAAEASTSSSSSETTATPTTGAPDPSTSSSGDPSTSEPGSSSSASTGEPPPEKTCSDVLDCLPMCLADPDLAGCLGMCANGLPPDQAANAIGLALCIGMGCFESGACTVDTLQDPLCLACIGFGLVNQTAPGCEDQAEACKNG